MPSSTWLRNRKDFWLLRGIAAVISLLLWITVLGGKKVEITKRVALDYQLPKDLTISNQAPREVTFRVSGPRAFIRELEERALSIPIDLASAKVGDYEVLVREEMLDVPIGLKVVSVSQTTIPLRLDRLASKRVPVRVVFGGQLPEGLKVVSVTSKPSTVEVKGASSRLSTLEAVPTEPLAISPNSLKQEFDAKLSLEDLPGLIIDDNQRVVHVVAELEGSLSRRWFKSIEVGLKVRQGSQVKAVTDAAAIGIRVRPKVVNFLLEGPENLVASLKETDIEVWAEIPELKRGAFRARLDWRLPPEVRVVRRSSDWIDVTVPPLR